jgi:hypothetical protein
MTKLSLVSILMLTTAAFAQQSQQIQVQAPQAEPTSAKKPAILTGRVVNAKTGEPVRRVNLTLRPFGAPGMISVGPGFMPPAAPYAATTDAEGKFRVENVDPAAFE